jgi:hypothetical protein
MDYEGAQQQTNQLAAFALFIDIFILSPVLIIK